VESRSFWTVTVVVLDAVTTVVDRSAVALGLNSEIWQFQPFAAVGRPITPLVAVPPVPTLTLNVDVPLFDATDGDVPKPLDIVGAVALYNKVPATLTDPVTDGLAMMSWRTVPVPLALVAMVTAFDAHVSSSHSPLFTSVNVL
jgi:hypothetical protein